MGTAAAAFGTVLQHEDTPASGTFTTIGGLVDVNYPELQADTVETTDMESPSAHRTHVVTLHALGDVTAELMWDSADSEHEDVAAHAVAGTIRLYKIVGTDTGAADWAFNAYVTRFAPAASRDGLMVASITLKPTGVVTRT